MQIDGNSIDCLVLNYAEGDKIYVPTFQIQLVSKYISDEGAEPKIHKIGSKAWGNQKKKAKAQIEFPAIFSKSYLWSINAHRLLSVLTTFVTSVIIGSSSFSSRQAKK